MRRLFNKSTSGRTGAIAPQLPLPATQQTLELTGGRGLAALDSSTDTILVYNGNNWLERWQKLLASFWLHFVLYGIIAPVDSLPIVLIVALAAWTAQFATNSPFKTVEILIQEYVYEYSVTCAQRSTSALEWLFSWWNVEVLGRTILQPSGHHDPSNYTMLAASAPDNIAARCYRPIPLCYDHLNFTSNSFYCDTVAAQTLWQEINAAYLNGTATLTPNFAYFMQNPDILDKRTLIAGLSLIAFPMLFLFARRKEARTATIQSVLGIIQFLFEMFVRFPIILASKPIIFLFDLINMVFGRCVRIPRGNINRLLETPSPILMSQALPTIQRFRRITCHRFAGTPIFWEAFLMIVYGGKIHLATDRMRRLDRQAKHGEISEQHIFNELHDHVNFLGLYKQTLSKVSVFHEIEAMIDKLLDELPGSELDEKKIIMQGATRDLLDLLFSAMQHYARHLVSKRLDADRSIDRRNTASHVANKRFRVLTALCEQTFKDRWYFYRAWKLNEYLGQDAMASLLNLLIFFPAHIVRYYIAHHTQILNETLLGFLLVAPKTERLPVDVSSQQIAQDLGFLYTGKARPIMIINPVNKRRLSVRHANDVEEVKTGEIRRRPRTSSQEMLTSRQRRALPAISPALPLPSVTFSTMRPTLEVATPPSARPLTERRELFSASTARRNSNTTIIEGTPSAAGAGTGLAPKISERAAPPLQPTSVDSPPFQGSPLEEVRVARRSRVAAPTLPRLAHRSLHDAMKEAMPISYADPDTGFLPAGAEALSPITASSSASKRVFMRPTHSRVTSGPEPFFTSSADAQVSRLNIIQNGLRRLLAISMQAGIIKTMKESFETPQAATQQSNSFQREREIYEADYARMSVTELLNILKSPVEMGHLQIVNVTLLLKIEHGNLLPRDKTELTEEETILKNLYGVFLSSCDTPVIPSTHAHTMRTLMSQLCPDPSMRALLQHVKGAAAGAGAGTSARR